MKRSFIKWAAALIGMLLVLVVTVTIAEHIYFHSAERDTYAEQSYSIDTGSVDTAAAESEWTDAASLTALLSIARREGTSSATSALRKCSACHAIDPGVHGVGPSLYGIVGKDIASAPGYPYSEALLALPGVWNIDALAAYLENPRRYAPGTSMAFTGLRKTEELADVIFGLMTFSAAQQPPPPPVGSTTTTPTDEVDPVVALMEAQLKSADLAFNRPETMHLGQATSVELVLSPATAPRKPVAADASTQAIAESIGLSDDLTGSTQVVEDVQYALQMEAEISGLGFDIHPPGPQRQTVLPFQSAKWVWTIEPKTAGSNQVFTVNVSAIVQRDQKELPPVRITTFTERITVEVTWMQEVLRYAEDLTTLNAAVVGLGGTLIAVLGWLWARVRKKKKAEPAKPTEVVVTHKFDQNE